MNAVERILVYSDLPSEGDPESKLTPPPAWPQQGQISFKDVELRYRPELPLVLKSISFDVKPGEKVRLIIPYIHRWSHVRTGWHRGEDWCRCVVLVMCNKTLVDCFPGKSSLLQALFRYVPAYHLGCSLTQIYQHCGAKWG